MDQRIRKLMTMRKALHPRDNVVSKKEEGRGLTSIKDSVDASIQWLKDYIEKHKILYKKNTSMGALNNQYKHLARENLNVAKKSKF